MEKAGMQVCCGFAFVLKKKVTEKTCAQAWFDWERMKCSIARNQHCVGFQGGGI